MDLMLGVHLLSSVPYYIAVDILPFYCYEVCYSVDKLLKLFRHSSRCEEYSRDEGSLLHVIQNSLQVLILLEESLS